MMDPTEATVSEGEDMANRKTGWQSKMSKYSRAKDALDYLRKRRVELVETIDRSEKELKQLLIDLPQVEAAFQAEARKVTVAQGEAAIAEFHNLADELDSCGESPARIAKWKNLIATLRTAGKLGQSHQATTLVTDRLRGLEKGYRPLVARSWGKVARDWVKQVPAHG